MTAHVSGSGHSFDTGWGTTRKERRTTITHHPLHGKKVAILIENGFEEVEMTKPRTALDEAGAETIIVSPQRSTVRAWDFTDWSKDYPVDRQLDGADPNDYDALLLPGGVINPDKLRMEPKAVAFAKSFFDAGKPVASICHGPWMVIEAGAARGKRIASWPSLKTDVRNAGAEARDEPLAGRYSCIQPRND